MSFYAPEQRCPRCRVPLTQGAPSCPNCGLALTDMGGAPRASRSGPPLSSWQPAEPEPQSGPPTARGFGSQSSSGPAMYRPGGQPAPGSFGGQSNSGPPMYRPGGQPAPGGSGPWGGSGGGLLRRPAPGYPQPPGASGGFSGAGNRLTGSGDASTRHQGPASGPRQPSTGWGSASSHQDTPGSYQGRPNSYQNPSTGYRGAPGGYQNRPTSHQDLPDDYWNRPGAWDSPSSYQSPPSGYRPTSTGWGGSTGYRHAPADEPETTADYYDDDPAPMYGRSQAFRGAPGPSWQQGAFGAPTTYPGSQPYYDIFGPPDLMQGPPTQPPPRRNKRTALILLVILVLLSGGGAAAYLYIQSKPAITVTSKYMVGTTPAGATTTSLHVTGTKFTAHSAVSFLLDGQPEPGHHIFQSDASGALKGDLSITAVWPLGQHNLTAKDAAGKTTILGKTIAIVMQGEAGTPGPNGAPADDASFTIHLLIHAHDNNIDKDETGTATLIVTGQPDPAGGTVCDPQDDTGQPQTVTDAKQGVKVTLTITCSGSYKSGKVTYKQIYSGFTVTYSDNGPTCTIPTFVHIKLDGSFTNAAALSGTLSGDSPTITCSNGKSGIYKAMTGTWTGSITSQK